MEQANPFDQLKTSITVEDKVYSYFSLQELKDHRVETLPFSIRVLLESALRNCDEFNVKSKYTMSITYLSIEADIETILNWTESSEKDLEIPFKPARVILQDFT
jgi:aconitate hydratase